MNAEQPPPVAEPPDHVELVVRVQHGDTVAMQDLLELLAPYLGRLCGPIALQDGPDATQEAMIAIFRGIGGLREPKALFGWARAIAVREAVRVAQRAQRTEAYELPEVPTPGDPQLRSDIEDVLNRLSPHHRAVLVLREVEGLDERTVGELLDLSAGTVKSRLHRARRSFRKAWER